MENELRLKNLEEKIQELEEKVNFIFSIFNINTKKTWKRYFVIIYFAFIA